MFIGKKTKSQLIEELEESRNRITELEFVVAERQQNVKQRPAEEKYRNIFENALRKGLEENYEALFESTGVAIAYVDSQGNYLRANDNFVEFIGYSREELIKMNIMEVTHPDYMEQTREFLAKQIKGEIDQFTLEKYYVRKDGTLRWGEMKYSPILDDRGRALSAVVAIIDRTQRKQAEERLKKYLAQIEDLYENAPCGFHSLGNDGTVLLMNDTQLGWLGYSRDEVIGKMKFTDMVTRKDMERFRRLFPILKEQGRLSDVEGELIRKDGSVFPVIINTTAIYDENGNYRMSRAVVFDNTDRKQAEDALAKSEALYRNLFENASIGMFQTTLEGTFLRINSAFAKMLGYDSPKEVTETITDTYSQIHPDSRNRTILLAALQQQEWFYAEQPYLRKDGSIMIGKLAIRKVIGQNGTPDYLEGIVEDVTERKQAEEALIRSEQELRLKAQNLEEMNATLKTLLNTIEKDKEELKERILTNIKQQVLPYLDKLKKTPMSAIQKDFVKIVEQALDEIASPFVQVLTSRYLNLTAKEIQIAALIKEGMTSKEIAELLNISKREIDFYRGKIRKKMGLKNKKFNLQLLLRNFS